MVNGSLSQKKWKTIYVLAKFMSPNKTNQPDILFASALKMTGYL